jgi:hypothetical protein
MLHMKKSFHHRHVAAITMILFMLAACTGWAFTTPIDYEPGPAAAPTLPCPVALSLSPEFTSYHHSVPGWAYHADFGPALQKYAIFVARSVFGDVQVLDSQGSRPDAKLLLVPRVTSSDLAEHGGVALGIQWDFKDPKTGQTLFTMHVQCETVSPGMNPLAALRRAAAGMMANLTLLTLQRFNASSGLQQLSGH